jgi:hypothetical protein
VFGRFFFCRFVVVMVTAHSNLLFLFVILWCQTTTNNNNKQNYETGYGDYTPQTQADKLYSIFFLPLAVAVFSEVLGRIATVYIQRKQRRLEARHLHRTLTLCDLRNMDTNADGAVDREEFILFMLQALQKVDRSTVKKLRDIFDTLDTNGNGILEYDDLIEIRRSNYLPALEQVQEAVRKNGLLDDLATTKGKNNGNKKTTGHHRRTRTSP